jgi:hypothetical protein
MNIQTSSKGAKTYRDRLTKGTIRVRAEQSEGEAARDSS